MDKLQSDIMLELHVPDFLQAKKFYGDIGYEVVWEKSDYLVMRCGDSVLNFYGGTPRVAEHSFFKKFPEDTPRGFGVEIIIPVTGITEFYEKFKERYPEKIVAELLQRYSKPDFRAEDPFGFYLRFVERYNWVDGRDKDGNPLED